MKKKKIKDNPHLRVILLGGVSEELDVGVSELGDRSHAAANTSAGERVGGAGGYLLRGKGGQAAGRDGGVGLNHLGGGERPAGSALSLVLDVSDGSLLSPVHGGWQVLDGLPFVDMGRGLGVSQSLVSSKVLALELRISEVRKLVDS